MINIRKVRLLAFYTQEQMAKELDISISAIQMWESGKRKPNLANQLKIVQFCERKGIDIKKCNIEKE